MRRLSVSETDVLNHLLTDLTSDDCTPSQLLRKIKQLNGDKARRSAITRRLTMHDPLSRNNYLVVSRAIKLFSS